MNFVKRDTYSPVRSLFSPPLQTNNIDTVWDEFSNVFDRVPVACIEYALDVDQDPYDGIMGPNS